MGSAAGHNSDAHAQIVRCGVAIGVEGSGRVGAAVHLLGRDAILVLITVLLMGEKLTRMKTSVSVCSYKVTT